MSCQQQGGREPPLFIAPAHLRLLRHVDRFRTPAFIARRLHLSQAALFERLAACEATLGMPLVLKVGEVLELTSPARALLAAAGDR